MTTTITRVFDTYQHAHQAVTALEQTGIPSGNISIIANKYVSDKYDNVNEMSNAETGATVGAAVGGGAGLLAGLGLLAIPGLGPVVAAGWFATTLLGAVAGAATGGLVGALTGMGLSEDEAHVYAESVRRGGTMVTVKAEVAQAANIRSILDRFTPINAVERARDYRNTGWEKFDPAAPPYTPSEAEIERIRRV